MFPHLVCVSVDGAAVQEQSAAVHQVAQAAEQQQQQQADGGEGHRRCGRLQCVGFKCNQTFQIRLC